VTTLAVREGGALGGPSVVLLHGVGNNGSMWADLMAGLPSYHCLAPDMPGHGGSRTTAWASRSETARLVAELIEERCGGRAHLVGLSLGGSVALELLATRSELLDHVIVDGCTAVRSPLAGPMKLGVSAISPFLRFGPVARLIGRTFGVKPGDGLDAFVAQMQAVEPSSFRRAFADANDVRVTAGLLAAPCRTLLVAGERELKHVRASNRFLADHMPHAEAREMPGASHGWGPAQFPDVHRRMVAAWLEDRPLPTELVAETVSTEGPPSDADWTITVTKPLPNCPSVQAGWERIATQTKWGEWRSESKMRGKDVTTTVVPPAAEPLKTGDEYLVKVGRFMKIRCRVLESTSPDTAAGEGGEMVFSATGVALAGIVNARFRFSVFTGEDGVIMARAQEKVMSLPLLTPSKEALENEHRHTLKDLNASFRSPSQSSAARRPAPLPQPIA